MDGHRPMRATWRQIPSAARWSPHDIAKPYFEAMTGRLFDPCGSQLRKLSVPTPGRIRSQINVSNKSGCLVRFKQFDFEAQQQDLYIKPTKNYHGLLQDQLEAMLTDVQGLMRV